MGSLRVLELYSGIGGMHYALKESGVPAQVVAAVDVNTITNQIYSHNFPDTPLWSKTIEGLTLDDFNKLAFDMILMSPPCQPFTRIGLQGDISDPRTKSFLYILDLLPRLSKMPHFILLENVKGFETSSARECLVKTLRECGYTFQEMLISPTCVGLPNSRLRYFLIAKASPGNFSFQTHSEILDGFPPPVENDASDLPAGSDPLCPSTCQQEEDVEEGGFLYKLETAKEVRRKLNQNSNLTVRQIQDFLEQRTEEEMARYLLPPKTLLRYAVLMDIVRPTCRRSVCFTKGYGHYVEGTGSVLQSCVETEMESVFKGLDQQPEEEKLQRLLKLKLRYFSPREIANLMGFPQSFSFPEQISTKQQYRALGNSLNVVVVARLIQLLVS
ncbi:tRNA (cytosine(38)-C(5))-methyltransferase [Myripristis murdjan]|uniref:tRNA (cytosine(38)-C(5))-methyltransferase n=1 Tax=Myripristis murdjan TaxID=586833 RepID=A0A668AM64_9TELE|nr:tRNA (cytosine(38)-C(5))-methyltransferase [Myripristis murdjan]